MDRLDKSNKSIRLKEEEDLRFKEDEEAYEELKLAGYDFFSGKFFPSEDDKQAIKELESIELVQADRFVELALCSTQDGIDYLQKQILSKAKGKRVIDGKGNGKGGGFMRTRG